MFKDYICNFLFLLLLFSPFGAIPAKCWYQGDSNM